MKLKSAGVLPNEILNLWYLVTMKRKQQKKIQHKSEQA
jgi:hypothetical protein